MVTPCRWEPRRTLESLPGPTPSPSSGFPSAVDIRYTQGKKAQKVRTLPWRPPRARSSPQQQHPLAEKRVTSDIHLYQRKKGAKSKKPLSSHRKPPRACGGSQQRHPSSGLPSRSHQTNCEGSHIDNPGSERGPKEAFGDLPSKDYKQGWVQGFGDRRGA